MKIENRFVFAAAVVLIFAGFLGRIRPVAARKPMENGLQLKINGEMVPVEWETNESVSALEKLAAETGGLVLTLTQYGGFEQVGPIGTRLPQADVQTVTQSGDIVLYNGSSLVLFYGSNSWAYTRLGRIKNRSQDEIRTLIGGDSLSVELTVAESAHIAIQNDYEPCPKLWNRRFRP